MGRRRELTEAKALLTTTRLLTLTGMGGVGKTRLAHRLAADLHRAFPDGVWLVELAELHEPALVAASIADSLGLREPRGVWTVGRLQERLADKHLLILLDNCEHLVDACAVTADALLRGCPQVHILATSRQPLAIDGERTLALSPLAAPDPERQADLSRLVEFDATRLFVDRAAAVLPEFTLDSHNQRAVAELCQRLGGLPLALEFAALRVRALSPTEILARLDQPARLSSRGSRIAPPRQQSLRALVDWSFQLCSEDERLLWRLMSVFTGSFELETVEAVCAECSFEQPAIEVLVGLVDKSVLMRDTQNGKVSYRMGETIRDYGREQLAESGQEDTARRRHRDWYVALVTRAFREYAGAEQLTWFTRLRQEHGDIRAALDYCVNDPDSAGAAADMVANLLDYWLAFSFVSEGGLWLDRLLRATADSVLPRARVLRSIGYFAAFKGEQTTLLEEARTLAQQAGDERELAWIAHAGALGTAAAGDYETATRLESEAIAGMRSTGDMHGLINALSYQAVLVCFSADFQTARASAEECMNLTGALGESWVRSYVLWALGIAAYRAGDLSRAAALELESLELRLPFHDTMGLALCTEVLAWVAADSGDARTAAALFGAAQYAAEEAGIGMRTYAFLVEEHDRCEARLQGELGAAGFENASRQGAELDDAQVMKLASGTSAASPPPTREQAPSPLTRREQQIAELVAQGLSNKEIAARLVISTRTAEGHVEHILVKLGFSSRAQIAAWVSASAR